MTECTFQMRNSPSCILKGGRRILPNSQFKDETKIILLADPSFDWQCCMSRPKGPWIKEASGCKRLTKDPWSTCRIQYVWQKFPEDHYTPNLKQKQKCYCRSHLEIDLSLFSRAAFYIFGIILFDDSNTGVYQVVHRARCSVITWSAQEKHCIALSN